MKYRIVEREFNNIKEFSVEYKDKGFWNDWEPIYIYNLEEIIPSLKVGDVVISDGALWFKDIYNANIVQQYHKKIHTKIDYTYKFHEIK